VSRATLSPPGSKKANTLPPLETTLLPAQHPLLQEVLELDEVWSFVHQRKTKRWVWFALCRRTRQVLAYAIGPRDDATCRVLWSRIPARSRFGSLYSDFWQSYANELPVCQHWAVGKELGETNHGERFNCTLRQRLARFVRQTLSFSKCDRMHELCLRLFLHDYNLQWANNYS
jgi:insertion element IS1 protein InsB